MTNRISKTPGVCGGRPCIRDLRIPVESLLTYASKLSDGEVLDSFPYIEVEDIRAADVWAAKAQAWEDGWYACATALSIDTSHLKNTNPYMYTSEDWYEDEP